MSLAFIKEFVNICLKETETRPSLSFDYSHFISSSIALLQQYHKKKRSLIRSDPYLDLQTCRTPRLCLTNMRILELINTCDNN